MSPGPSSGSHCGELTLQALHFELAGEDFPLGQLEQRLDGVVRFNQDGAVCPHGECRAQRLFRLGRADGNDNHFLGLAGFLQRVGRDLAGLPHLLNHFRGLYKRLTNGLLYLIFPHIFRALDIFWHRPDGGWFTWLQFSTSTHNCPW